LQTPEQSAKLAALLQLQREQKLAFETEAEAEAEINLPETEQQAELYELAET